MPMLFMKVSGSSMPNPYLSIRYEIIDVVIIIMYVILKNLFEWFGLSWQSHCQWCSNIFPKR